MKFIRATIRIIGLSLTTIYHVLLGYTLLSIKKDKDFYRKRTLSAWAKSCLWLLNVKLEVSVEEEAKPQGLLMANHRSYVDVFVLFALYPSSIIAMHEISKWPVIGLGVRLADIILVKRGNMSSSVKTMRAVNERVAQNKSVILFPEGRINKNHRPGNFKNGTFLIASNLQVAVTPIALWYQNKEDAWYKSESFIKHFYRQMGKHHCDVKVKVLAPILEKEVKEFKHTVHEALDKAIVAFDTNHS